MLFYKIVKLVGCYEFEIRWEIDFGIWVTISAEKLNAVANAVTGQMHTSSKTPK